MFSIYQITNKLDGNSYIGYTTKLMPEKRFCEHIREAKYKRRNGHLYNAMMKYGVDNFRFDVLEVGENNIYGLKVAEPLYIKYLNPKYNVTIGGEGQSGVKWTDEHRKLHSKRMQGKNHPMFGKPSAMRGRTHSEESKALIREKHIGIPRPIEVREKISKTKRERKGR